MKSVDNLSQVDFDLDCSKSHSSGRKNSIRKSSTRRCHRPRWQAIIKVGYFVEQEPEVIWPFVLKWGSHEDEDLRSAIATCLLEHLLEYHFDLIFPRVEEAARTSIWFGKTVAQCWKLGAAKENARAERFDRLLAEIRESRGGPS